MGPRLGHPPVKVCPSKAPLRPAAWNEDTAEEGPGESLLIPGAQLRGWQR